eukprot:247485-Amphidinium_carterae.1
MTALTSQHCAATSATLRNAPDQSALLLIMENQCQGFHFTLSLKVYSLRQGISESSEWATAAQELLMPTIQPFLTKNTISISGKGSW